MNALTAATNPAVRRLVRRDLAQNKGRTATLFLLTFLPVLFVGWMATVLRTEASESNPDEVFGQADAIVRTSGAMSASSIPWPGEPRVVTWVESQRFTGNDWVLTVDAPLDDPLLDGYDFGTNVVVAPTGSVDLGDGAVDVSFVSLLDWDDAVPEESILLETVGIDDPQAHLETRAAWLALQRDIHPSSTLLPSLFMVGLSVATGAIAFAAWGSSIRRRLRTVGLFSASGAEPSHAAAVQGGQALVISAIGSVAAIGALLLVGSTTSVITSVTAPGVSDAAVRWPVAGLLIPALIAVVVATFAGWWPARSAARMPLDALLSGRRVPRGKAPGVPVLGTIAVVAGLALLGASVSQDTSSRMMVMGSVGIIAIALGSLPVLAAVFARLGSERLGSSMPVTPRLVLREASRHANRSAASVLGIGAIVAAVWLGTVDAVQQQRGPDDQPLLLLIGFAVATVVIGLVTAITASEVRDDLSAMTLIGSGPLARARFLGTQAFIICAVGVVAGVVVGTMIRFAVDDGLPIPWTALLALVGLPFVLGLCVMAVQSVPLAGRRPAVSR